MLCNLTRPTEVRIKMELSNLGDDELLAILSYLSVEELLECRVVCRRWRDAALHPHLWRMKRIDVWSSLSLAGAVLRLAPCLKSLILDHNLDTIDECGLLFASTSCAISEVCVINIFTRDAFYVALTLARQATLGRLKRIRLTIRDSKEDLSMYRLRALLHQLLHTQGLEVIELDSLRDLNVVLPPLVSAAEHIVQVPASLRDLTYTYLFPDPYLHLRLEWHAATLEVVKLSQAVPRAASLLSAMPRLRELDCPLMEGMAAMAQCEALESLALEVNLDESTLPCLPGAETFLRAAATRLEYLMLEFGAGAEHADSEDLVLCLGGAGQTTSALQRLFFNFQNTTDNPPWQLLPLTAILQRLPLLTTLDIDGVPSDDFLAALDGEALPLLVDLCMRTPQAFCPHSFAHSEPIKKLLQSHPRLHVSLADRDTPREPWELCDFCDENKCHPEAHACACVIFSHPEGAICGVDHYPGSECEIYISLSD